MRIALRLTLALAIAGAAGAAHALQSEDWGTLDDAAQDSLEYGRTDESSPWENPDSESEGTFTPVATHEGPEGQVCREYAVDAIIDGREEVVYGTACRRPDGTWVEANAEYTESEAATPATEVYSGTDWRWIIPNITIAGGYCSSSFCVGGYYGSYYPSWYAPWGINFSYWDYGRYDYGYPYYGNHHRYRYPTRYVNHDYRYKDHDRHRYRHKSKHQNHYRSADRHRDSGHQAKRSHSRDRRSDRDRSTKSRSNRRRSDGAQHVSNRTDERRPMDRRSVTHLGRAGSSSRRCPKKGPDPGSTPSSALQLAVHGQRCH
jgi:surface antigen